MKSSTRRETFKKYILIACGSITPLVLISIIIAMGFMLFSGPDAFEITESHPFRSEKAQEKYLTIYDEKEKMERSIQLRKLLRNKILPPQNGTTSYW